MRPVHPGRCAIRPPRSRPQPLLPPSDPLTRGEAAAPNTHLLHQGSLRTPFHSLQPDLQQAAERECPYQPRDLVSPPSLLQRPEGRT